MIKRKSKQELERMRASCHLAAEILHRACELTKEGVTLNEIDTFVYDFTIKNGAYPSPLNYHGYPKSVCTSINEVVTHGIPDNSLLQNGDIVNIDITCKLKGYHGDTSRMVQIGEVSEEAAELVETSRESMWEGIRAASRPGARFGHIGSAIQGLCDERGFSVVRDYCGHGIGRGFHEDPLVLHYRTNKPGPAILEGMVFTIEPMVNAGTYKVETLKDGWTVLTADRKLSAQFEHTVAITANGLEVLTDLKF